MASSDYNDLLSQVKAENDDLLYDGWDNSTNHFEVRTCADGKHHYVVFGSDDVDGFTTVVFNIQDSRHAYLSDKKVRGAFYDFVCGDKKYDAISHDPYGFKSMEYKSHELSRLVGSRLLAGFSNRK